MPTFFSHSNDLWEVVPVPNVTEKHFSSVPHLPVESFRTKGLPAQHVQHTLKEQTRLLWQKTCLVMVCTPADQPSYRLHCSHLLLSGKCSLGQIKTKQNGRGRKASRKNQFIYWYIKQDIQTRAEEVVTCNPFSIHVTEVLRKCLALGNRWCNKYLYKYCSILSGKLTHNKMYKTLQFILSHTERCLCWSTVHLRYLSPSCSTPSSLIFPCSSLCKFFKVIFKEW